MCQSGFKRNHSKDFCLAQLIDFVLAGMDKQMHTSMILAHLQEAFDTLDHRVRTSVIKWFESYLSNRKLWVCSDFFMRLEHSSTVYHEALFLDCYFFYCI